VSFLQVLIAILLVAVTIIPLSPRRDWWIRALDFPRVQFVIAAALWMVVWLFHGQGTGVFSAFVAFVVFAVLAYQFWLISPFTEVSDIEVDGFLFDTDSELPTLKLLLTNVMMSNRDSAALLRQIETHQPDIFVTVESDQWWQDEFESITKQYPHSVRCPLDNLYGMHLYSRLPLDNASIEFRRDKDKPTIKARVEVAPGNYLQLYVLHPAPPSPALTSDPSERDVELIDFAYDFTKSTEPAIVAADLNDVPWSETTRMFRHVSGFLDPRIGRGLYNTFNVFRWYGRWPLNHVFMTEHFKLIEMQRLEAMGSDHYPLLLNLASFRQCRL